MNVDEMSNEDMLKIVQRFGVSPQQLQQQSELDIKAIYILMSRSKTARKKYIDFFGKEADYKVNFISPNETVKHHGLMIKYAFLVCVRSRDSALREQSMTTFRNITNIDDNAVGSDIKKMIDITPGQLGTYALQGEKAGLIVGFSALMSSAVQVKNIWIIKA